MGSDTVVEVGADPSVKLRIQEIQKQIAESKKQIDTIHPVLKSAAAKLSQGVKFKQEQLMYFQELLQQENMKKKEIEAGIKEQSAINAGRKCDSQGRSYRRSFWRYQNLYL